MEESKEPRLIVKVTHEKHYGRDLFYPSNETAKAFAGFAKVKSFTREGLAELKSLGIKIEIVVAGMEDITGD